MKQCLIAPVLALAAAPAFAGSIDEPIMADPVMAPAPVMVDTGSDWSGFYVGGQLGYGDVEADTGAATIEGDGGSYGVHAGYLFDTGSWVFGGELDYDESEFELDDGAGEITDVTRLKLIAGYDAGQFLPYVTLGAARAGADVTGLGDDLSDSGRFAGLGVSYRINESWRAGGEVLFHEFDDFEDSGIDVEATTITARISYNF